MGNEYKVAMIGCGNRGRDHLPGFKADPRIKVVGLADPKRENAEALNAQGEFGAGIFSNHCDLLEAVRPDVVVTCLWTHLHLPVFRDCVGAGVKAVLSEKPMAITWGECRSMAELAESSGVQLTFCHQRRFAPGNLMARKLLADGVFGELERMDLWCPPHLLDCGTHSFDQALSFNQESRGKWVLAAADTSELVSFFDVRAEHVSVGTVVFQNGVRANFQFGGPDRPRWSGAWVYGSKGCFFVGWDGDDAVGHRYDDASWTFPVVERPEHADIIGTVKDTIDGLETGKEPELSHKKAIRAAEIIFAGYESIRRRAMVEIPFEGFEDNPLHSMLDQR